jgi:hypothetical protein
MTVYVAEAHAHVQRLVSVVKMASVPEECIIEEQHSVVRFLQPKGLNAVDIYKECFLFTVGRVCRVKRFTTESTNVTNLSLMTSRLRQHSKDF